MKQKKSTKQFLRKAQKQSIGGKAKALPKAGHSSGGQKNKIKKSDVLGDSEKLESYIKVPTPGERKSKLAVHQGELDGLAVTDPEFFKFLQKNDAGLLDFHGNDNEDTDSDEDDVDYESSDDEEERVETSFAGNQSKKSIPVARIDLTTDLINKAATGALNKSVPDLKRLLSMFRSACVPSGDMGTGSEGNQDGQSSSKYIISSPALYQTAMLTAIDTAHIAFSKHLDLDQEGRGGKQQKQLTKIEQHPNWKKMEVLVLSYFKSILHTLSGLAESAQPQADVCVLLLGGLEPYVPLLTGMPRLTKQVMKVLLSLWAKEVDKFSEDEVQQGETSLVEQSMRVRGMAFLRIRQLAVQLPGSTAEEVFRSTYLAYARHCRSYNEHSSSGVNFMAQSVAELYRTDLSVAYQQSFVYIRQLVLHLRAAMLKKSDETIRQVTGMQFLNCLRLWTRVICSHPSLETGLGALAFPLTQLILGVIANAASAYYIPLKLHLVRCLQKIAAHCQLFVPTASVIFEIVESADLFGKPTPSTDLAPKFEFLVKLPANSLGKVVVRDTIVLEALHLIRQDAEVYRFHVGVPEYSFLTLRRCKAFLKQCRIAKWRDLGRTIVAQLEQHAAAAQRMRVDLGKAPMSITDFEPLLPSGQDCAAIRLSRLVAKNKSVGGGLSSIGNSSSNSKISFADVTSSISHSSSKEHANTKAGVLASAYGAIRDEHYKQLKAARKARAAKRNDYSGSDSDESISESGADDDIQSMGDYDYNVDSAFDKGDEEEESAVACTRSSASVTVDVKRKKKKKKAANKQPKQSKEQLVLASQELEGMPDDVGTMDWDE